MDLGGRYGPGHVAQGDWGSYFDTLVRWGNTLFYPYGLQRLKVTGRDVHGQALHLS